MNTLNFELQEGLYIKDPNTTKVGKSILKEGITLLHLIGLENFTFKKLAKRIHTTESSLYRYFENKHQFLSYLHNYYWAWMDFSITIAITNIEEPEEKLKRILLKLTQKNKIDIRTPEIDEELLQEVIALESSKTYLTKTVDEENNAGYFLEYKKLIDKISVVINEINPNYPYPKALISTVIESSFHQRFFGIHLPRLTNEMHKEDRLFEFLFGICINTLKKS
jgi:AcrR family transcriptional regulator